MLRQLHIFLVLAVAALPECFVRVAAIHLVKQLHQLLFLVQVNRLDAEGLTVRADAISVVAAQVAENRRAPNIFQRGEHPLLILRIVLHRLKARVGNLNRQRFERTGRVNRDGRNPAGNVLLVHLVPLEAGIGMFLFRGFPQRNVKEAHPARCCRARGLFSDQVGQRCRHRADVDCPAHGCSLLS